MPKVFIAIVTWNGEKFIKNCLDSILKQSYQDFTIQILDNGSQDSTVEIIKKDYPQIYLEEKKQNLGFARAYNELMLRAKTDYVLIVNQDTILDEKMLEHLVATLDKDDKIAVVAPALYRLVNFQKSNYFDSLGLVINKFYQVRDSYAGVKDENIVLPKEFEVFGVSGALAMFRKSALESVRYENEYFDNDFFAYKEDVDLAMRLRLLSWKAYINRNAIAYHARSAKENSKEDFIKHYLKKSDFVKKYSFRNEKLFKLKTAQWHRYGIYIIFYNILKSLFVFIFSPKIWWQAQKEYWRLRKRILQKRKMILKYIKTVDLSNWIK